MDTPENWKLRLHEKRHEFGTTYTFAFEALKPLAYQAGQWVHLAATPEVVDRALVRHMSIASAPGDRFVEFTMDVGSATPYKRAMSALKPGDEVAAFKLKGEFVVKPTELRPVVFVAGGLGITPIRAILRDLHGRHSDVPRSLVHVARGSHLYADELGALPLPQWRTNRQGLDAVWPLLLTEAGSEGRFYVCGSERFIVGLQDALLGAGIGADRIVTENFR